MNPKKILELYQKYLKDGLFISGVRLVPYKIDKIYTIYYKIDNPDDISYSEMSLRGWVAESLNKFYDIIGFENEPIFEILGESFYVNDSLMNELGEYFKTVKKIVCNNNLLIDIEHKGFSVEFHGDNSLLIENYVVPLKASIKLTNGREKRTDLDFAIERYKNHQKLSKYDETEFNYIQIDTILENKEALIDPEWMVEYVVTKFKTL
jgi:hypothetical protein